MPAPYWQLQWGLLGLWAGLLAAAFAFGKFSADRTRRAHRPLLMATSALLVVMAALFWLGGARNTRAAAFSLWLVAGMALSFVADLTLAQYIRTPQRVIFGGALFALAHCAYIAAGAAAAAALGVGRSAPLAAGFVLLGAGLWAAFIRAPGQPRIMNLAFLAYMLVLSLMAGLAAGLALSAPGFWRFGLGAALFLLSDVILLNQLARKNNWLLVSDVVWVLYIGGQALIVWSNLPALGPAG